MPQVDRGRRQGAGGEAAGAGRRSNIASSVRRRVGEIETVLVERDGLGRTEQFVPIAVPGHGPGEIVAVRVTGVSADGLVGEPIRTAA